MPDTRQTAPPPPAWEPSRLPDGGLNTSRPSTARIYDHLLGGKDNFAADREAADELVATAPEVVALAVANRYFAARAAAYCATAVDQIIDLGPGLPTPPTVAGAARQVHPDISVIGVDNDPVVLAHGAALAHGARLIAGDITQPEELVRDLHPYCDFTRPVALIAAAVLHFVPGHPASLLRIWREVLAPGSLLVVSHVTGDGVPSETADKVRKVYERSAAPAVFRTEQEIAAMFAGLELVSPGLVDVQRWRPDGIARPVAGMRLLGGVGRVTRP
ncbi:SAM-dependent methyltransferase [Sphaerisporangium album]|uniref:SAM-dependent methyltransferase n=1 Tax=Sphaerisporangium album TaxID=509200 RepID=UPI0015F00B23|nr:SAM-dependent methyltransferase [Sphaerisporangium album]